MSPGSLNKDKVLDEFKKDIRSLLISSKTGSTPNDLMHDYAEILGRPMPLNFLGFHNVLHMAMELPDVVSVRRTSDGYLLKAVGVPSTRNMEELVEKQRMSKTKRLKNKHKVHHGYVQQPAEQHKFQRNTTVVAENGLETKRISCAVNSSLEEHAFSSPDQDKEEWSPCQNKTVNTIKYSQCSEEHAVPVDVLRDDCLKDPVWHTGRQMKDIQLEYVQSPGRFYVTFADTADALLMVMMKMRGFYSSPSAAERYKLPWRFLRPGQACCVMVAEHWFYRVTIQRVVSYDEVEVFLVDYGDSYVVKSDDLKFLKTCFSNLPAQAVLSSVAGIKPTTGSTWSPEAILSFRKMCRPILVAFLDGYVGDTLHMYLISDDKYVHCALITRGHALASHFGVSAEYEDEEMPALELIDTSNM
ncbi:tudor domain-containing protein 5-like isoform X2 [Stigmatopora nigra]